ncbi:MAG: hypothetical protein E6G05_06815 [Actinobacteria bacterium]|jgi:hypothetical protein|nr:MAG: hypothetical protein E6G05_06815 [Actinomycetota bacterium]
MREDEEGPEGFGEDHENFEDTVRSIAHEIRESVQRMAADVDVDDLAGYVGVDPDRARDWMETAAGWLGAQLEHLGDEFASRTAGSDSESEFGFGAPGSASEFRDSASHSPSTEDPLRGAAPHPLDIPTTEQGRALAALESGRWFVEPASSRLESRGEGPAPSDTLGLVRELRARDWIAADGELTLAGRHALTRWLQASTAT